MLPKKYTKEAKESVKSGMTLNATSKVFKIPKTTLHRRTAEKIDPDKPLGAPSVLTREQEEHLYLD